MLKLKSLGCIAAGFLIAATPALAWNDLGHMTVAAAAWKRMTPEDRQRASTLLRLNPDYATWVEGVPDADKDLAAFVRAATWPDHIRSTYTDDGPKPTRPTTDAQNIGYRDCFVHPYWHFRDKAFSPDGTPTEATRAPNALTQITAMTAALSDPGTSTDVKSYDLSWLLHLVGDVHQPLHGTARFTKAHKQGDHGGNGEKICVKTGAGCDSFLADLHKFWDHALGDSSNYQRAAAIACLDGPLTNDPQGKKCLPVADTAKAAIDQPATWLDESADLAQSIAYQSPIGDGSTRSTITTSYRARVGSVAQTRVALGGARLATLLHTAFASAPNPVITGLPSAVAQACPRLH